MRLFAEFAKSVTPLFSSEEDFDEIETKVKTMARVDELSKDRKPTGL